MYIFGISYGSLDERSASPNRNSRIKTTTQHRYTVHNVNKREIIRSAVFRTSISIINLQNALVTTCTTHTVQWCVSYDHQNKYPLFY
jgi:hypothetical protein